MGILLAALFILVVKTQLYPLIKKSYKKEAMVYVFIYLIAAVLLIMVDKDATSISFFL